MKMSTNQNLTPEERRDLDKFAKFLALKSAVIIVESRLGSKVYTKCNAASNKDVWFNLAVNDVPEVSVEAKKLMSIHGELTTSRRPLCVEIYLRTADDDVMTLETWCIGVWPTHSDSRMNYSIYGRMGILLKTLVSVTRVTPAYRMSRRQGPDSYTINYKIYMGDPQLDSLGDGYKKVQVGQLATPIGTVHLSVSYRTDLTIQPQKIGKDNSITHMYKSDHFRPDFSPKNSRTPKNDDPLSELSETIRVGAFASSTPQKKEPIEPDLIIPDLPFSSLLTPRKSVAQSPPPSTPPPSIDLSDSRSDPDVDVDVDNNGNVTPVSSSYGHEDFIMVELKTPFTSSIPTTNNNSTSDLSVFYKECQTAPPLLSFKDKPVSDLTKQLEDYEAKLEQCNDVIRSMCLTDETETDSSSNIDL